LPPSDTSKQEYNQEEPTLKARRGAL
jgi:hypothetical protein